MVYGVKQFLSLSLIDLVVILVTCDAMKNFMLVFFIKGYVFTGDFIYFHLK
jgi:hypothetical protein